MVVDEKSLSTSRRRKAEGMKGLRWVSNPIFVCATATKQSMCTLVNPTSSASLKLT